MNEKKLIKEKMKNAKKKVKEEKKENKSQIKNIYGIILGIVFSLLTCVISKEATWYGVSIICFMCITFSFLIHNITEYITFKTNKYYINVDGFLNAYWISGTISLFIVCYSRNFGFLAFLLPIIFFIYAWFEKGGVPNYVLEETFHCYHKIKSDEGKKAILIERNKMRNLVCIFSALGAIIISGIYKISIKNDYSTIIILITTIIGIVAWNLVVMLILKLIARKKEKLLNTAFDLKISDSFHKGKSNLYSLYNFSIMYYRTFSFILTFIALIIVTKLNWSLSILMVTIYYILNLWYPAYDACKQFETDIFEIDNNFETKKVEKKNIRATTFDFGAFSETTYRDDNGNETKVEHWKF